MLCLAFGLLWLGNAQAQALSVTAKTVYHGYQIQLDPLNSSDLRNLNRFYSAIEGGGYRLGPKGQFDVVMSFRFDTDFGTGFNQDTPFGAAIPRIDDGEDLDLLLLYVDWRNAITRNVDLRVGRQIQMDDLDWYVHDGLKFTIRFWQSAENRVETEIYAGVPVRFDALFSSSDALLGDGTEVYDGDAPFGGLAVGGSVYARLLKDLSISLSARNELIFRSDEIEGFGPAVSVETTARGTPIDDAEATRALSAGASGGTIGLQESLVGGSLGYTIRPLKLSAQLGVVFNILTDSLDRFRLSTGFDPTQNIHLGIEYMRIRPRFAGDSIFNWFNIFPYDKARLEGNWSILDERLTFEFNYFIQIFRGEDVVGSDFAGENASHGPGAGLSWRQPEFGVSVYAEGGTNLDGTYAYGGNYLLASLSGDVELLKNRLRLDSRLSVTTVQDDWFEDIDAGEVADTQTTYTGSIGARVQITDWLRARTFVVGNIDPTLEGNYRVYSELVVVYR